MLRLVVPKEILQLWLIYQENGLIVSGKTTLKVEIKDFDGNIVLADQDLIELGGSGFYYFDWTVLGIALGKRLIVYYKDGAEVIYTEEFIVDNLEDEDVKIL
jgi:hypothetical protein